MAEGIVTQEGTWIPAEKVHELCKIWLGDFDRGRRDWNGCVYPHWRNDPSYFWAAGKRKRARK